MADSSKLTDNNQQTRNDILERRMLLFASSIIKELRLNKNLPFSVIDQLTRSSASIGANYAEACNASSKLDFRNKVFIAKKEAAETKYWISLVLELGATKEFLNLRQESQELLMILQAIINTMKGKSEK